MLSISQILDTKLDRKVVNGTETGWGNIGRLTRLGGIVLREMESGKSIQEALSIAETTGRSKSELETVWKKCESSQFDARTQTPQKGAST
jgi:hypothetical protein